MFKENKNSSSILPRQDVRELRGGMTKNSRRSRFLMGFSAAEMIVVVAIGAILAGLTYEVFVSMSRSQTLKSSTAATVSLLNEARTKTLASRNSKRFGVHFGTNQAVFFSGDVFNASDPGNITESFAPLVSVKTVSLNGGGQDVIFNRLTGETDNFGTVTLAMSASSTVTSNIVIYKTGLAEGK